MSENLCRVGDVELCYETIGDAERPALLLVMGWAMQMIAWPDAFCQRLAEQGFFVIRYDNRDVGRSSRISAPVPTRWQLLRRSRAAASYTLEDMATDAVGLLDHLGMSRAHVAGVSMGGMIGQRMAVRHPQRVLSLASIMSTTGPRRTGRPHPKVAVATLRRPGEGRAAYVRWGLGLLEAMRAPGAPIDEAACRDLFGRSYDRGFDPDGPARQMAAIFASGDLTPVLHTVTAPTVVIHGARDPVVGPAAARATAQAIAGSRLLVIDGMGHALPPEHWPKVIAAIADNAARATAAGEEAVARQ